MERIAGILVCFSQHVSIGYRGRKERKLELGVYGLALFFFGLHRNSNSGIASVGVLYSCIEMMRVTRLPVSTPWQDVRYSPRIGIIIYVYLEPGAEPR